MQNCNEQCAEVAIPLILYIHPQCIASDDRCFEFSLNKLVPIAYPKRSNQRVQSIKKSMFPHFVVTPLNFLEDSPIISLINTCYLY